MGIPIPSQPNAILHCATHPQVETRLRCSACERPICPKCMVMCEVGLKCPACVGQIKSHTTTVTPPLLLGAGALGLLAGFLFGVIQPWLLGIGFLFLLGIPLLGLLLCYGVGQLLGRAMHRILRYKLGPRMVGAVTAGALSGLLLGHFGLSFLGWVQAFGVIIASVGDFSVSSGLQVIRLMVQVMSAILFVRGLQAPFQGRG